jgi:general secretion pathway protein K
VTRRPAGQAGFALIAVLLVLALLGIVGSEFAFSMRLEASAVRAYKDAVLGTHLAEAGVQQAIREIAADYALVGFYHGVLTFFKPDGTPIPLLPRAHVALGSGEFSYTLSDEEARLNINTAPPERVDRLLQCLGIEKSHRDVINDSIQDWRDADENHRLNGAESEDTYLKLPVPYRSHNTNLESVHELLQVKGITPTLFSGNDERPGLVQYVSVKTGGPVNINTAEDKAVMCALGLSQAEITTIDQTRRDHPYVTVPGQFGGRGFAVTSRTFRIDAEGQIGGRTGARITAIVQKRPSTQSPQAAGVAVLEWTAR